MVAPSPKSAVKLVTEHRQLGASCRASRHPRSRRPTTVGLEARGSVQLARTRGMPGHQRRVGAGFRSGRLQPDLRLVLVRHEDAHGTRRSLAERSGLTSRRAALGAARAPPWTVSVVPAGSARFRSQGPAPPSYVPGTKVAKTSLSSQSLRTRVVPNAASDLERTSTREQYLPVAQGLARNATTPNGKLCDCRAGLTTYGTGTEDPDGERMAPEKPLAHIARPGLQLPWARVRPKNALRPRTGKSEAPFLERGSSTEA